MPNAIAIDDLSFGWPGQAGFSLEIPRLTIGAGEHVFLHGQSGSGKTTLLNLVAGVLRPVRGGIRILDKSLATCSGPARDRFRVDHMGFIFQQFNLIPYLSVRDNVLLPCWFSRQRRARAEAHGASVRDEAERLLRRLDLDPEMFARPAATLSVGQQQRVAAARALIGRPEIIIADEPTSSLDADRQSAFLALLLEECARGAATLLFVSHDARLADRFARRIALSELHASV